MRGEGGLEEGVGSRRVRVVVKARRAVVVWGLCPEGQRGVLRGARGGYHVRRGRRKEGEVTRGEATRRERRIGAAHGARAKSSRGPRVRSEAAAVEADIWRGVSTRVVPDRCPACAVTEDRML